MENSCACILIADDLTGACDAAVQFKLRGVRSVVHLDFLTRADVGLQGAGGVHAFNTETRDAAPSLVEQRFGRVAQIVAQAHPQILFKKIDSLLRGNPGREIVMAMEVFGCDLAIVTPAFPEMGRTVANGFLEVPGDPDWNRLEVAALLREQGLADCAHGHCAALASMIESGTRYISLDAGTHQDQISIVAQTLSARRKVLWAGSGGLAAALANVLFPETAVHIDSHRAHRASGLPVVFCIGSGHPVTSKQILALSKERAACEIHLDPNTRSANIAMFIEALQGGRHTIVHIPLGRVSVDCLGELLQNVRALASALVVSGGDTASAFCRAMHADKIELAGQVIAGLPWGVLRGGLLDGFPIATKSGAFGREDDLVKTADFFSCSKP